MLNTQFTRAVASTVLSTILLSACTTYGKYDESLRESEIAQQDIQEMLAQSQYNRVEILDEPPQLINEIVQSDKPDWLKEETKVVANNLPLSLVIKQIVGKSIPIRYGQAVNPYVQINNFYFEGSKEEALNILELNSDFGITPTRTEVRVEKFLTKTYHLPTVIGSESNALGSQNGTNTSSEDASSGEITSTGSGDGQFTNQSVKDYNLTHQIYEGINKILTGETNITTGNGDQSKLIKTAETRENVLGYAQEIQGLSSIVVRTSPSMMKLIDGYVNETIDEMTKEVELEVTVIEYQQTDGTEFGIDAALSKVNSKVTYGLTTVAPNLADTVDNFGFTGALTSGSWAGTSILINALRDTGDVSVSTQQRVTATNHKTQEIDLSTVSSYFKKIKVTKDDDDTTTDIDVSYLRDGVKMLALPNIANDRLYLKVTGTLSKVISQTDEVVNEVTVSKPTTRQARFNITGAYEYDKPFIVTHMRQTTNQADKTRFADVEIGNSANKKVIDTLVVITPRRVTKPKLSKMFL